MPLWVTSSYQMGSEQGFLAHVLAPIQAMAQAAKERWEGLRPLPVRAAAARAKVVALEGKATKQAAALLKAQPQEAAQVARREHVRLQTELAAARQESALVEGQLAAAQPPAPDPVEEQSDYGLPAPLQALAAAHGWMATAYGESRLGACQNARLVNEVFDALLTMAHQAAAIREQFVLQPEDPATQAAAAPAALWPEHADGWQPESAVPAGEGGPYPQGGLGARRQARGDQDEDLDASMASAI